MEFDYKNHYKRLINDLTEILIKNIEQLPECDKDTPPEAKNEESVPVIYSNTKHKRQPPLKLD